MDKALELVGEWKVAFGAQTNYKAVVDVFFELEREGFHVPETQVRDYIELLYWPLMFSSRPYIVFKFLCCVCVGCFCCLHEEASRV